MTPMCRAGRTRSQHPGHDKEPPRDQAARRLTIEGKNDVAGSAKEPAERDALGGVMSSNTAFPPKRGSRSQRA